MKVVEDLDCIVDMLESGEGDVIAANYTVTKHRKHWILFSNPILSTSQVLVQPLPDHWWSLSRNALDDSLISDLKEIDGDTIFVRRESSFYSQLLEVLNESACPFTLQATVGKSTEQLIKDVSNGKIDYTVADENVARLNKTYFPNIDITSVISDSQKIA